MWTIVSRDNNSRQHFVHQSIFLSRAMGTANHPDPPIVSVEESTNAVDKVFLDAKLAGQLHCDENSDPSSRGSPRINSTLQSDEMPSPIHHPNIAAYPEYGSHQLTSNNWITLKLDQ